MTYQTSSENYDHFWPYRVGIPGPLPPSPVEYQNCAISAYTEDWDHISSSIREICAQRGVAIRGQINLVWRSNSHMPNSVAQATLLIDTEWEKGTDEARRDVCERIHHLLLEREFSINHVEIIDYLNAENAYDFPPIHPDVRIAQNWETGENPLEPQILSILEGLEWQTLTVLSSKAATGGDATGEDATGKPVVFLTVWKPRLADWEDRRKRIRAVCFQNQIEVSDVVIAQAYDGLRSETFDKGRIRDMEEFLKPKMGASFGASDRNLGAGTLGGFFVLRRKDKDDMHVAMTCYHVVRTKRLIDFGM